MNIQYLKTKSNKTLPVLLNDNGQVIPEIYKFMRFLVIGDKSTNTVISYCQRLKLYYEWLNYAGLDYHSAVAKKSENNRGMISNFSNFKVWLKFGDFSSKIVPIGGYTQKRTAKTINLIFSAVLSFYDYLALEEGIEKLPVYKKIRSNGQFHSTLSEMTIKEQDKLACIFKEREVKKKLIYITRKQFELCYENATSLRNKIIVGLCYEGALRVSEVIGLQLEDLKEIHKGKIIIKNHHDTSNRDAAVKYDSEGIIFITERLQQDIIRYINEELVNIDTNYLLVTLNGDNKYEPMTRRNIEKMFATLGKKVGIKGLHPHALRHGLAIDMLSNDCKMIQIKDTLRHRNLATTSDIYADYDNEKKKELINEYQQKVSSITKTDLDELADFLIEDEKEDF